MATPEDELWIKGKCLTASGPYLQPFAPNPDWRSAEIFIVGLNPVTSLREEFDSFDHFWRALTSEPELYERIQHKKYLKCEATRSRTSLRIAELLGYLSPHNTLVTNVFAYPSSNPSFIPRHYKREPVQERILSRLLIACKPKVVLFHGAEARKFACMYFGVRLDPYLPPTRQKTSGLIPSATAPSMLLAYHHLVGRVDTGEEMSRRLKQFARRIRHRLCSDRAKSIICCFITSLLASFVCLCG